MPIIIKTNIFTLRNNIQLVTWFVEEAPELKLYISLLLLQTALSQPENTEQQFLSCCAFMLLF